MFHLKTKTMKTSLFFAAGMLIAAFAFGQKNDLQEVKVTPPSFHPNFIPTLYEYLEAGIEYPAVAKKSGWQGTVVIQFVVTAEGNVTDFYLVNSVSKEIDNEVIRVLETTNGRWNPGTADGSPVAMEKEISVAFKISPNADFVALAKDYIKKANEYIFVKNQPQKAIKYLDKGIMLLPNEECLLASRSLCNYEIGNMESAQRDWQRIKYLTEKNESETNFKLADNYEELSGYKEMLTELAK